tara:strand:- start:2768 stop:4048 length:1281 start_codon:yes stop_codon:yes gene_type:complete
MNNKVAFYTLGCKLNFSETSTIAREFYENGYQKVDFNSSQADYYVINTCSVTENANKECRKIVRKIKNKNKNSYILITGCYAQLKPEEVKDIPGVNAVVSNANKSSIFGIINKNQDQLICHSEIESDNFYKSFSFGERTRSFLKIQDGCDYKCTFCTIPLARGMSRNQSIRQTIYQVKDLINKGVNEIVLTGVNIGDFGRTTNESFYDLVQELENINDDFRIRISSIEPNLLTEEIVDIVANSTKFLPHFHIPLQSGSNKILKLMRRRYDTNKYYKCIEYLQNIVPNVCIGADVIVGFPGETEQDFLHTFDFIKTLNLSYLHVFSYSNRDNTKSVKMKNQNSIEVIKKRSKTLRNYSDKINTNFKLKQVKKNSKVLFETFNDGYLTGLSENYIKVRVKSNKSFLNKIVPTKFIELKNEFMIGELVN